LLDFRTMSKCHSNHSGRFSCKVPQGKIEAVFEYPGYLTKTESFQIQDKDIDIGTRILKKRTGVLNLFVKDTDGFGVGGALIKLSGAQKSYLTNSSGKISITDLALYRDHRIKIFDENGDYESQAFNFRLDSDSINKKITLTKLIYIHGFVKNMDRSPLADAAVSIRGTHYRTLSKQDGSFKIPFSDLGGDLKKIELTFKRHQYFTEKKTVNLALIDNAVIVRMRDEREKITSFTTVRIMNSVREIRSELDDLQDWMIRSVDSVNYGLKKAQDILESYASIIDSKNAKIDEFKEDFRIENLKEYLSTGAMILSVKLKGLLQDIRLNSEAMAKRVKSQLAATRRFVKLFKKAAELRLPVVRIKIESLEESVKQSPFLDKFARTKIEKLVVAIATRFDIDIQEFYKESLEEIEEKFSEIEGQLTERLEDILSVQEENETDIRKFIVKIENRIKQAETLAEERKKSDENKPISDEPSNVATSDLDPCSQVPADDCINLTNRDDLVLVRRVAGIHDMIEVIKAKIQNGVNEINGLGDLLDDFLSKIESVNANIIKIKKMIDHFDQEVKDYQINVEFAKEFVQEIPKIISEIANIGKFDVAVQAQNTGDLNTLAILCDLILDVPKFRRLGSPWSIPLPKIDFDLSKILPEELLKLREKSVGAYHIINDSLKELLTERGNSKIRSLFPQALYEYSVSNIDILPHELSLEYNEDLIPEAIKNFDMSQFFDEKITAFRLEELSANEKEEILSLDAYTFVKSHVSDFFAHTLPPTENELSNLSESFLIETYLSPKFISLYKIAKSNDEDKMKEFFRNVIPDDIIPKRKSKTREKIDPFILLDDLSDSELSDYLKSFLSDDLNNGLDISIGEIAFKDLAPDFLQNLDYSTLSRQFREDFETSVFNPEITLVGTFDLLNFPMNRAMSEADARITDRDREAIEQTTSAYDDLTDRTGDRSMNASANEFIGALDSPPQIPFHLTFENLVIGYNKARGMAYLRAKTTVDVSGIQALQDISFGDSETGASVGLSKLEFGEITYWGDKSTQVSELVWHGRLKAIIAGFGAEVTMFKYNFNQNSIDVNGKNNPSRTFYLYAEFF